MSEQEIVLLAESPAAELVSEELMRRRPAPSLAEFQQQFEQYLTRRATKDAGQAQHESAAEKSASPEQVAAAKKKRNSKKQEETPAKPDPVPQPGGQYVPEAELAEELAALKTLSQAAQAGDTQARDQLRTALDHCPHLWRRLADLQIQIEETMAQQLAGPDLLRLESFRKRASEIRAVLLDRSTGVYLQLAGSRLVACWLFCQFVELRYLTAGSPASLMRQLVQAEHRFESALQSWSLAKRLEQQLAKSGS